MQIRSDVWYWGGALAIGKLDVHCLLSLILTCKQVVSKHECTSRVSMNKKAAKISLAAKIRLESSLAKIGMGSRGMYTTDISYFDSLKPYPWLSSVRTLEMKIEKYIHKLPLPIVLPGSYLVTTADRTHRDNQGSNACAGTPFLSSRNEPNHD